MKVVWLVMAVVLVVVLAAAFGAFVTVGVLQKSMQARPGRYLLLQGKYEQSGKTTEWEVDTVFKIDTQTGEAWEFLPAMGLGKERIRAGWSVIEQ